MIKGILQEEEIIIKNILREYKNEYSFYYYGSRVKGNFEKTSDLDILIMGKNEMPLNILSEIKDKFDNSLLPYVVNFSDFHSINPKFYELIKDDLVEISI